MNGFEEGIAEGYVLGQTTAQIAAERYDEYEKRRCWKCGARIPEASRYCLKCGRKV